VGNLVVFNGGLMRGQSAHWKLRGATFLEAIWTAPIYRLYSIGDRYPAMLRDDRHGASIAAELYHVPDHIWPRINNIEPPGLYRGPVTLIDGREVEGMLGEAHFTLRNGSDISHYQSWANYPFRTATARIDKDPDEFSFDLFVNGTLMRGLALHPNLKMAPYLGQYRTEPNYRIYSINDIHPGMYPLNEGEAGGVSVEGELYRIPESDWPALEASEPPGLYRGRVRLEDGSEVWGILYPRELIQLQYRDISTFGGWRAYMASLGR
jgi:gamma-glutamylcyclotransferase (GGCT)/AIG2-like uncharacterized protein YtfP